MSLDATNTITPCPICGTAAGLDHQDFYDAEGDTTRHMYWVWCETPNLACLSGPAADSPEAAIAVWDRICAALATTAAVEQAAPFEVWYEDGYWNARQWITVTSAYEGHNDTPARAIAALATVIQKKETSDER